MQMLIAKRCQGSFLVLEAIFGVKKDASDFRHFQTIFQLGLLLPASSRTSPCICKLET